MENNKTTDCEFINGVNYCEKKKRHIVVPQDCYNCKDYAKKSINESVQVLID